MFPSSSVSRNLNYNDRNCFSISNLNNYEAGTDQIFFSYLLDNQQQQSKDVLQELENIDGKADNVGIAFVKINDLELVDEYNLGNLPAIVYFRHETPILYQGISLKRNNKFSSWNYYAEHVYTSKCSIIILYILGDLMDEAAVLEWLIQNRSTGDEEDVIEDVDIKSLDTMIQSIEHLAVLFCKNALLLVIS